MAKREIKWSANAKIELFDILNFYFERNRNSNYSIKVNDRIQVIISYLQNFPNLGMKTTKEHIRVVIESDYSIFYEHTSTEIIIHSIWANKRNPEQLQYNK